ncbi:unnamed protein product [Rotaria socialis]|uniref:Wax synthase domain-containing protein n=1 Tax=Rotaria socialis TaxID=392032 RepID=A0A818B7Q7_9BILA|nr:unnamed protein product [Rotaria socialis]CAF4129151.1 unnamed protein product [Rotaria socialis]
MAYFPLVMAGWLVHSISCFYLIRTIRHALIRTILTLAPCILLTHIGCQDLTKIHFFSILTVSLYWMMSIRLIHLTVLSPNKLMTFHSFVFQILWNIFPIVSSKSIENQWPIIVDFISVIMKVTVNHWLYEWLLSCEPNDSYARITMFYFALLTTSYMTDMQTGFIRLITRDEYTLEPFTNFPLFSRSLHDFWGRRYNRLVGTVLKESIFQPLNLYISSREIMTLITFIVSGLLHVHIVIVVFNDVSSVLSTFAFFIVNGIACGIEAYMKIQLPQPLGSLVTHLFLLLTAPMCIGIYTREAAYFPVNVPPLYDNKWIPKFSIPSVCPK